MISSWKAYDAEITSTIEQRLQQELGNHWGVCRLNNGYLEIAVIDTKKSTPEQRAYYFGQSIDIRYEQRNWMTKDEKFECNCGSCGPFNMEGGSVVGERATFYIGIGQLYGNAELVAFIKKSLADYLVQIDRMSEELDNLRKKLSHPIPENNNTK